MSYTNETTFYGLPLPTGSDKSTFTDNNTAFQAVDAALHTAYEQSGAATEDIVAIKATVANLLQADIDFQNDLDTEKGKIRNLQDKEVLQDAEIAAVKADAQDMITAYNEPTATSTHAYSVGDFFIYNDVLYRATDTIAIGDTIVPDTNCKTTNVSTELIGIKSDLTDKLDKAITVLTPIFSSIHYTDRRYWFYKLGNIVYVNCTFTVDSDISAASTVVEFSRNDISDIPVDASNTTRGQKLFLKHGSSVSDAQTVISGADRVGIQTNASLTSGETVVISGVFFASN